MRSLLAAAGLGVLHGLSFDVASGWWLQLAAMAAFVFLTTSIADARRSALALRAAAFALCSAFVALAWIHGTLAQTSGLGGPLAFFTVLAVASVMAGLPAATLWIGTMCAATARLATGAGWVAILFGAGESLRLAILSGFPWQCVGDLYVDTPLAALFPWVGVHGVSTVAVWIAAILGLSVRDAITRSSGRHAAVATMAALALTASVIGVAKNAYEPKLSGAPLRAVVAQPATSMGEKFSSGRWRAAVMKIAADASHANADLIITPETVIPTTWAQVTTPVADAVTSLVANSNATVLLGMYEADPEGHTFNAAVTLKRSAAGLVDTSPTMSSYRKRQLMPFGEYTPWGMQWFVDLLQMPGRSLTASIGGAEQLSAGGVAFRPTICLEIFIGNGLTAVPDKTGFITNQSNFVWTKTLVPQRQLLAAAQARALEQRKPVLLAGNNGPSGLIGQDGRVLALLPPGKAGMLTVTLVPQFSATPYGRFGDMLIFIVWCLSFALALVTQNWRRRLSALQSH